MSALTRPLGRLRARRRPLTGSLRTGCWLLGALIAGSLAGMLVLPDPRTQDLADAFAPPGTHGHLLGTDQLGRDVLAWCAAGVRTALVVSLAVVLLSALVGVTVGLVAGYFGGVADAILMRLVELQLAIPPVLLFIAASIAIGNSMASLILLLSVVGWLPYARVVRAKALGERERAFIAAARLAGTGRVRLLATHLLPTVATLALVLGSLQAGIVLLWESGLSFLGLGLQLPTVSLGFEIAQGRSELEGAWWIVTFPGLTVVLLVLAFNLIGDGLRDRFQVDVEAVER